MNCVTDLTSNPKLGVASPVTGSVTRDPADPGLNPVSPDVVPGQDSGSSTRGSSQVHQGSSPDPPDMF